MSEELILSIATVMTSIVAIIISINMARKQNKITLFDKKIDGYNNLILYFEERSLFASADLRFMDYNVKFNSCIFRSSF